MRNENEGCGIFVIAAILTIAISFGFAYLISTSDLPVWMKFWLLN